MRVFQSLFVVTKNAPVHHTNSHLAQAPDNSSQVYEYGLSPQFIFTSPHSASSQVP